MDAIDLLYRALPMATIARRKRGQTGTVRCEQCGKEFQRLASQARRGVGRYCSRKCHADARRKPETVRRTCEQCGKGFDAKRKKVHNGGGRFCGRSCATKHRWARDD